MHILCLGDIAISDNINSSWLYPLLSVKEDDFRILFNWELPIGTVFNPSPRNSGPRLLSEPNSINVIHKWAPAYAALATNHILDGGEEGLVNTIHSLNLVGFETFGAGISQEESSRSLFWETQEGRLAVINWVFPETHPDWLAIPGPNCWPGPEVAKRIIRDLKNQSDWVLVFAHWSDELFPYPRPEDRMIAHELTGMGADIIIGHHPHVVRGLEMICGKPVYYSLGNFYFSQTRDKQEKWVFRPAPRNREALVVKVTFEQGQAPKCETLSYWQGSKETKPDSFHRAVRRMRQASRPLVKYRKGDYSHWYQNRRSFFDRWEYRLNFGLWRIGKNDWKRMLGKIISLT